MDRMSTQINPIMAALGGGQQQPSDPTQGLMQQAQQSLSNPMAQSVPQGGGLAGLANHPVVQAIIKAISSGAGAYGWTSTPPEQRLQAQQLEQQKAETMARLAQTSAYQQGELGYRRDLAAVAQQNADTKTKNEASQEEQRKTMADIAKQKQSLADDRNEWQKDLSAGRLDAAKQRM